LPAVAKKPRTPTPPRPVQAPKTRTTPTDPAVRRRRLMTLGAIALGTLLVAAAIGAFVALGGGGSDARSALEDAGCTLQTYPGQEGRHVEQHPKGFKYNSFPRTTGPHNPQPATFGIYKEPLDQLSSLHNLEHGGVAVQYGDDVPEADVKAVEAWYEDGDHATGVIVAPLPALGDKIALTAWNAEEGQEGNGILAKCTAFDEGAFDAYLDEYRFKGPERFPEDALLPGM
jgi:hypothetical protein